MPESKTRIIVKEQHSKKVREYELEDGTNYYCYGCFTKNKSKTYAFFDDDGFFMVPQSDSHICEPIAVETSIQDQKRKRAIFMEARKTLNPAKPVSPKASPVPASVGSSKVIPFVDLTDASETPSTGAYGNFVGIDADGEEMVSSVSIARSNASSPEYLPELGTFDSNPSSPSITVTNSIKTNVVPSSLSKTLGLEMQASGKNTSGIDEDQISLQSFNVTETSSDHIQSMISPSGSTGKENEVQGGDGTTSPIDNVKVQSKIIKTDGVEDSIAVITLDETLDDADQSLVPEENDDYAPVQSENYQYGYSSNGVPNSRLIVFDRNRYFVRQYSKISHRKQWFCLGCYRAKRKHNKAYFVEETFMVPTKHSCKRFTYTDAKEMQMEYIRKMNLPGLKKKPVEKVHTRCHTVARSDGGSATSLNTVLSSRSENQICQKVIKTERSEFDDGYPDFLTTSSPVNDIVGPGNDEDYHPSNEIERYPTQDFQFGYSAKKGNRNGRLIVFEPNDKTKVRQYALNNCDFYFCIECFRLKRKKFGGKIDGSTFMAPKNHFCTPVSYEKALEQQKEIVEKFALGHPSAAHGGSNNEPSVKISQRSQKKRESFNNDDDESDEENGESAQPIPCHIIPTHNRRRLILADDFEYGVGNANQENCKIIVFEENDQNFVRVYGRKTQRQWYCCGCLRSKHTNYGTLNHQTFNAPIDHTCKAVTYESVLQIQQRIKDRYRRAALSNPSPSTPASNSGPSLLNVAPVKPGSSISPPQNNNLAPQTAMNKRYDEERLRNLVTSTPRDRFTTSSINENSSVNSNQSLSLPDPNKSYIPSNYREVLSKNWQYGYDSYGNPNKRIIVRDDKNPDDAHEYRIDRNNTRCLGCSKNGKVAAKIMNGILYIPPSKDHTCEPRNWAEIQRLQREYKKNMGGKRGRTDKSETTAIKRAKIVEKASESNPEDNDAEDSFMDSSNVVSSQIIADMSKVNKAEISTKFSSIAIFEEKKWKRYGKWDAEESAAPIFVMEVKDGKYNPILTLA
uniref:Uncharacterized protein n=1 Tax=Panagrolaimus sp. PS1159 TaxID=55785 RepID=A0AC35FQ62_9BILA